MSKCWTDVYNKADGSLNINLHEDIGFWGTDSKDFAEMLNSKPKKEINVDINSDGGDIYAGLSMYNMLKAQNVPVNTSISGLAASMASVVFLAGDNRTIAENAHIMIHNPWGYMVGESDDMRKYADVLDKLKGSIVNTYLNYTDKTEKEVLEMVDQTTYLDADESIEMGFATEVGAPVKAFNKFDFSKRNYGEMPSDIREKFDKNYNTIDIDEMEKKFKNKLNNIFTPKQEPDNMADKELMAKFEALETSTVQMKADFEAQNKANEQIINDQKKTIENLTGRIENSEKDKIKDGFKNFCADLVRDCKLKPADVDVTVENLMLRQESNEELVESYKEALNSAEPFVKTGNYADKRDAGNKADATEGEISAAIAKHQSENKCSYKDAYNVVMKQNPQWIS